MRIFFIILFYASNCLSQIAILGHLTHEYNVQNNECIDDVIEIRNSSNYTTLIEIYKTDYSYTFEGKTYYNQPAGRHERSNADWVTITKTQDEIPLFSKSEIAFSIHVPDTVPLPGTYWSIIMIEPEQADDALKNSKPVNQVVRYAIQIITHVGGNTARSLKILDTRLIKVDPFYQFQIDLENDGTLLVKPKMSLELFTSTGQKQAFFEDVAPRLFPGTSIRYHFDLVDVPFGEYQSLLLLDCGEDALFGAKYQLKITQ